MSQSPAPDPRYPIGPFRWDGDCSPAARLERIRAIEETPAQLRAAVTGLDEMRLDTPYRDGGWTVRQVVHHVADSHMNSYARFRLALTEDTPVVKPYDEARWAELADARSGAVETSLVLIEALHARWVALLRSITPAEWERSFQHPEIGRQRLDQALAHYSWHGRHHTAQVAALRARMGW